MPKAKRGLDLDGDRIGGQARAVVRAMHDETAGAHRLQAGQTLRHPIGIADLLESERLRRRRTGEARDQRSDGAFVRRLAKMDGQLPLPAVALEGGADQVAVTEAFVDGARQAA